MTMSEPRNDTLRQARLDEALADYLERLDRGQAVDREQSRAEDWDVADDLRGYFEASDEVDRFAALARTVRTPQAPGAAGPPPAAPATPRCFGDYEMVEEIAHGGMGV